MYEGYFSLEFCYLRRFFDEKVSALLITMDLNDNKVGRKFSKDTKKETSRNFYTKFL